MSSRGIELLAIILLGALEVRPVLSLQYCGDSKGIIRCKGRYKVFSLESAFYWCDSVLCQKRREINQSDITKVVKRACYNCKLSLCPLPEVEKKLKDSCSGKTYILNYRCFNKYNATGCESPTGRKTNIKLEKATSTGTTELSKTALTEPATNIENLNQFNKYAIWIGVAVGGVVLLSLLVVILVVCIRGKRKTSPDHDEKHKVQNDNDQQVHYTASNQYLSSVAANAPKVKVVYENVHPSAPIHRPLPCYQNIDGKTSVVYENQPNKQATEAQYVNDIELPVINPEQPYVVLDDFS